MEKEHKYRYDLPNRSHYPEGVSGNLMGANRLRTDADRVKALRSAVVSLVRVGSAQFARDLQCIKPQQRLAVLIQLLRFVLPRPQALPMGDSDEAEAQLSVSEILKLAGQNADAERLDEEDDEEDIDAPSTTDELVSRVRRRLSDED